MFWQNYFKLEIVQEETLPSFLSLFRSAKKVFWDTETTGLYTRHEGRDYVVGYTFAFEDEVSTSVFYVPVRHEYEGKYEDKDRFKVFKKDYMVKFPDFHPEKFEGTYENVDAYKFAQEFKNIFESGGKCYIAHNINYDLHTIANEGIDIVKGFEVNDFDDTQIMVHTIDETTEKNLESVTKKLFGIDKSHYAETVKTVTKDEKVMAGLKANASACFQHTQIPIGAQYSAEDVFFMKQMYPLLIKGLEDDGQYDLYKNYRIPYFKVLWKMERKGVKIDVEALDKMTELAKKELENFKYEMISLIGQDFNPDSLQHLFEILFGYRKCVVKLKPEIEVRFAEETKDLPTKTKTARKKALMQNRENIYFEYSCNDNLVAVNLGFKPVEYTDGGQYGYDELKAPKTGTEVLKKLMTQKVSETAHKFVETLIDYKKMSKLISAFMDGLREQMYNDGKVHCSFNICGTDSWRLSSQYPRELGQN